MKKILGIVDLCSIGGCSGNTFIMAESALKLEPVLVPSSIFTYHTDMKKDFIKLNCTAYLESCLREFIEDDVKFDGILIGYVSEEQIVTLLKYLPQLIKEDTIVVLDPIILNKDLNGKYEFLEKLSKLATFVTPNPFEAKKMIFDDNKTIYTGIKIEDQIGYQYKDKYFMNKKIDGTFYGCGDLFAALLLGYLVKGKPVNIAISLASNIVHKIITKTDLSKRNYTIDIESNLKLIR